MRLLSDAAEYALRAVVWLAANPDQPHTVRDMAQGTQSSPGYLVKVLQHLARAEIVSAQRGLHGGFSLKRDPKNLTVLEVVNTVDPIQRITTCPLNLKSHGIRLCPLHRRIDNAIAAIEDSFRETTIEQLLTEPNQSKALCEVTLSTRDQ